MHFRESANQQRYLELYGFHGKLFHSHAKVSYRDMLELRFNRLIPRPQQQYFTRLMNLKISRRGPSQGPLFYF